MPIKSNPVKAYAQDEDGAVAVVVALLMTVLLIFVAFGTDLAIIYRDRARLQARSDLAALGTAGDLEHADARLEQMLAGNNLEADTVQSVQFGRYLRNPAVSPEERFQSLDQGSPGVNAIVVRLADDALPTFARILTDDENVRIYCQAMASRIGAASFSLRPRFLEIDASAISDLLSQSVGLQVTLSARDLEVLAEAQVNMADLLEALAERLGYDPLNPADVLTLRPSMSDLIHAMQAVLPADAASRLSLLQSLPVSVDLEVAGLIAPNDRDIDRSVLHPRRSIG